MSGGEPLRTLQADAEAARAALAKDPDSATLRLRYAELLRGLGRHGEAMEILEAVIYGDPALKAVCQNPDTQPDEAGRCRVILENCRHILARYPEFAPAWHARASAQMHVGRMTEARASARRAAALNPAMPVYHHVAVRCGDAAEKAAAETALSHMRDADLPPDGAAMRHFLLAQLADEKTQYADAFAHWREGNALRRAQIRYDEAYELTRMQAIAAAFGAGLLDGGGGCADAAPVFVVGMLRSGTTLVEQVLASLPGVYGAGELTALPRLIAAGGAGTAYPRQIATRNPADWTKLGERYVAGIRRLAPDALRVVDKMPLNFLHLGTIRKALPQARIVHVLRDPLDTCFSCYAQMFSGDVGFAWDLGELGRYYCAYRKLMAHWRAVLPADMLCEVRYEDLVDDLDGVSRRLADFCGVSWSARCLEFYRTDRAVGTASAAQVRRPLSRGSIGRAGPYAPWLAPLRAVLSADASLSSAAKSV